MMQYKCQNERTNHVQQFARQKLIRKFQLFKYLEYLMILSGLCAFTLSHSLFLIQQKLCCVCGNDGYDMHTKIQFVLIIIFNQPFAFRLKCGKIDDSAE